MAIKVTDEVFENGTTADGDAVQRAFDDVGALFPVAAELIDSVRLSDVIVDTTIPPEAIPPGICNPDDGGPDDPDGPTAPSQILSYLCEMPTYVQGLGLTFHRRLAHDLLPTDTTQAKDGGWLAPILDSVTGKYGVIYCSGEADTVHVITPGGGDRNDTIASRRYDLAPDSRPVHAVASRTGDIYVLCQSDSSKPRIDRILSDGTLVPNWLALWDANIMSGANQALDSVRKIVINRFGTYLYVIGRPTGTNAYDTVTRVKVSDPMTNLATATWTFVMDPGPPAADHANNSIVDIVCFHADETVPQRTHVAALYQVEENGTTDRPLLCVAVGDENNNTVDLTTPTVDTLSDPTGAGADSDGKCLVMCGSNLFLLSEATSTTFYFSLINYNPNSGGTKLHTILFSSTAAGGASLCPGSACYGGTGSSRGVYAMLTNGNLLSWGNWSSSLYLFSHAPGWAGAHGDYEEKSSVTFTGRTFVVQGTKKTGASYDEGLMSSGVWW